MPQIVPQRRHDQHCTDSLTALTIKRFSCSWFLHCVIFLNQKEDKINNIQVY